MRKLKTSLITAAVTGLLAASSANAWTTISPVTFTAGSPSAVMSIKSKSFSDPAFGHQAWAMHGRWGVLNAEKGKSYTIKVSPSSVDASGNSVTPVVGLHPAVAVWKRPIGTVANPYVYYEGAKAGYQKDASGNFVKDASGNKILNSVANRREVTNLTDASRVPDHNFFPVQSYINSGQSQQHVLESGGGSGCSTTVERTITGLSGITDASGNLLQDASGNAPASLKFAATPCKFWAAAKRTSAELTAQPGVLLEDGATDIGFPRMLFAAAGYDADGFTTPLWNQLDVNPGLKALRKSDPGTVEVVFKANETAQYEFFVGGLNPDAGHTVAFYPVDVAVTGW